MHLRIGEGRMGVWMGVKLTEAMRRSTLTPYALSCTIIG